MSLLIMKSRSKIDVKHTDLNKDTKYNTYKYNGLPVGPISSISTEL